jgi:hypothetical protein
MGRRAAPSRSAAERKCALRKSRRQRVKTADPRSKEQHLSPNRAVAPTLGAARLPATAARQPRVLPRCAVRARRSRARRARAPRCYAGRAERGTCQSHSARRAFALSLRRARSVTRWVSSHAYAHARTPPYARARPRTHALPRRLAYRNRTRRILPPLAGSAARKGHCRTRCARASAQQQHHSCARS